MTSFKVLRASFMQVTHSFSPVVANLDVFKRTSYHLNHEVPEHPEGTPTELGEVLDLAERFNWELALPVSASTTPSGLVTAHAYDHITGPFRHARRPEWPLDQGLYCVSRCKL